MPRAPYGVTGGVPEMSPLFALKVRGRTGENGSMKSLPRAASRERTVSDGSDPEVLEMEGFKELGDRPAALQVARRVLSRKRLAGEAFSRTVQATLAMADDLEDWQRLIEAAWKRMSPCAQRHSRDFMLAFRYSTNTLDQALPLATLRPRDASDFFFCMATYGHHRREAEAEKLLQFIMPRLGTFQEAFEVALIWQGLAEHHLRRKDWAFALFAAANMPHELVSIRTKYHLLAEALKERLGEALGELESLRNPDHALSHGKEDEALVADAKRDLARLRSALEGFLTHAKNKQKDSSIASH